MFHRVIVGMLAMTVAAWGCPACAPGNNAIGVVWRCARAHIGHELLFPGTNIYDGEELWTEWHGKLQLRSEELQIELLERSAVTIRRAADGVRVELKAGTLGIWTGESSGLRIAVCNAQVCPARGATVAVIQVIDRRRLTISVSRGALLFTYRDQSATIETGSPVEVTLDPTPDEKAQFAKRPPPARSPRGFIVVPVAVSSILLWIAVDEALESPDRP